LTADEDLSQKGKEKPLEETTDIPEAKVDSTAPNADSSPKEAEPTEKNDDIKLEITNPDDLQIDDKGQMEMF
jgi:topoisomerase-4 subunit A